MRIGSVVVDCNDFDAMVAFWREALHYVPREPPENGWVVLRDPAGATRHPRDPEPDDDFIVLEDPEGNLFCVVDTSRAASG